MAEESVIKQNQGNRMTPDPRADAIPIPAEIIEVLSNRYATLGFLSRMYQREIEPELLAAVLQELRQWPASGEEASRGQSVLRAFAAGSAQSDTAAVAADLSAEYVSIFFSSWRRLVSPYESVYTSEGHSMMQEPSAQLQQLYAEEGLQIDGRFKEPADHIALELAFLGHLCHKTLIAAQEADRPLVATLLKKQERFLNEHLLTWAPQFCQDLAEVTHSDFYRGLAWLTAEFLETERPTLDDVLETLATDAKAEGAGL